ncbi:autotransporter outer membrane beta-barrel domain-containing protein [Candidatus Williamhamiltonella defendens]|nr:autotransporter outer membrane beta-barrel domain-containing protein [Candidatus Hamiltonella defensa]
MSYLARWEFLRTLIRARLHLWGHVAQQIGKKEYADTRGTIGVKYHFQ